jgi:hypothetical protein
LILIGTTCSPLGPVRKGIMSDIKAVMRLIYCCGSDMSEWLMNDELSWEKESAFYCGLFDGIYTIFNFTYPCKLFQST